MLIYEYTNNLEIKQDPTALLKRPQTHSCLLTSCHQYSRKLYRMYHFRQPGNNNVLRQKKTKSETVPPPNIIPLPHRDTSQGHRGS